MGEHFGESGKIGFEVAVPEVGRGLEIAAAAHCACIIDPDNVPSRRFACSTRTVLPQMVWTSASLDQATDHRPNW